MCSKFSAILFGTVPAARAAPRHFITSGERIPAPLIRVRRAPKCLQCLTLMLSLGCRLIKQLLSLTLQIRLNVRCFGHCYHTVCIRIHYNSLLPCSLHLGKLMISLFHVRLTLLHPNITNHNKYFCHLAYMYRFLLF